MKGTKISKQTGNDLYFDNIIPFGLIQHTYNFTFELDPHFFIDENIYNISNRIFNEEIIENN